MSPKADRGADDYRSKRDFAVTPEPPPEVDGDVDPSKAPPGRTFVIHQHHATRLHFDLRLEMMNGSTPVLVSWAVPKNLPLAKGVRTLAIHVEDHPFEYGSFSGTIPEGYGAGEVRIFDAGSYDMLEQEDGKLTFRLVGRRLRGVWHLIRTRERGGKQEWLAILSADERSPAEPPPRAEPMLASAGAAPFDDDAWVFEPKWDGVRAIAHCDAATKLVSRNANDISAGYPELMKLHEMLVAIDAMVDGEIVAMEGGRPSFQLLQRRMHVRNPRQVANLTKTIPVTFVAFDLLYLDGRSLVELPFSERRALLEEVVVPAPFIQVSTSIPGAGTALFAAAQQQRLEGIVAKKTASRYEPGRRSKSWLKIKTSSHADVVIGGWSEGDGYRTGRIGSLLAGLFDGENLIYVGSVGTGFDERTLDSLGQLLAPLSANDPPFTKESISALGPKLKKVHWVRPEMVCVVEYREFTSALKFRAPAYKGLREDKDPGECVMEQVI